MLDRIPSLSSRLQALVSPAVLSGILAVSSPVMMACGSDVRIEDMGAGGNGGGDVVTSGVGGMGGQGGELPACDIMTISADVLSFTIDPETPEAEGVNLSCSFHGEFPYVHLNFWVTPADAPFQVIHAQKTIPVIDDPHVNSTTACPFFGWAGYNAVTSDHVLTGEYVLNLSATAPNCSTDVGQAFVEVQNLSP